jgi:hypothetical protein
MMNIKQFSENWISDWNSLQIDRIMSHYAEDIEFHSPLIRNLGINPEGVLKRKSELEAYFKKGLALYPDLFFDLHEVLTGTDSVILYYTGINKRKSAEFMQFDAEGKVKFVRAHYND